MSTIIKIFGREIVDSRGNPTVEVDVHLKSGAMGRTAIPSGASTGTHEAVELRDHDDARYGGKGVLKACENINNQIFEALSGLDASNQKLIDNTMLELDGTKNKSRLGSNAILGVSCAVAVASAKDAKCSLHQYLGGEKATKLPVPMMNIINGGAHANNSITIQEFMIMPVGAETIAHAVQIGSEIFQNLKSTLVSEGHSTNVGDEGGFAPEFANADESLNLIMRSIETAGYIPGDQVLLALDCAASEYFNGGRYKLSPKKKSLNSEDNAKYLADLVNRYPIFSIEDGMDEDDWNGWSILTEMIGDKCQLVGDDLFVTNSERLKKGIKNKVGNAILIKPNQIGTLSETIEVTKLAQSQNYTPIISHRSGETEDSIIAEIAVGTNANQIKAGSLSRSDRLAKYNQLIRIEEELGSQARYCGKEILNY